MYFHGKNVQPLGAVRTCGSESVKLQNNKSHVCNTYIKMSFAIYTLVASVKVRRYISR